MRSWSRCRLPSLHRIAAIQRRRYKLQSLGHWEVPFVAKLGVLSGAL